MQTDNTPVIVGVGQYRQPRDEPAPLDPLGLMAVSCLHAFADTSAAQLASYCDTVRVVNIFSHSYRDVCANLAALLGISPARTFYSPMGGNTPQLYINRAAEDIAAGKSRMALIAGAEAGYALRRGQKGEVVLDWPKWEAPERIDGEERPGASDFEYSYDLLAPVYAYALFENALRHAAGMSIEDHRQAVGRICEHLCRAAARNPYAWTREEAAACELTAPSPENRMIGFPYTLRMTANLNVDLSAAVLMTSRGFARELGIPEDRWVYPMGGAALSNVWNVSRRLRLHDSPALALASRLALSQAGLNIDNIDFFDLYSCFPSAVEIARNELGIGEDDQRDLTVTGGLPYFGGPGNNYSLHGIAGSVERIRTDRNQKALVTALGWFNTKWAVGVYGSEPGARLWGERDDRAVQEGIDSTALPEPVEQAEGDFTIDSYVVVYNRFGEPDHCTVIGRLADGPRTFALLEADSKRLAELAETELIGMKGQVRFDEGVNRNILRI